MAKYAVTFQIKYNDPDTVHSVYPDINGNNFMVFEANDMEEARILAYQKLNNDWAFMYPYDEDFFVKTKKYHWVEYVPQED